MRIEVGICFPFLEVSNRFFLTMSSEQQLLYKLEGRDCYPSRGRATGSNVEIAYDISVGSPATGASAAS